MTRVATCACRQLTVTCEGEPHRVSVCYCLECQKRTGSAFGVQARFRRHEVTIEGRSTTFVRTGDEGCRIEFHFCPTCGSTVYYEAPYLEDAIAITVGSFADPSFPAPHVEVYVHRRHPWAEMPRLDAVRED